MMCMLERNIPLTNYSTAYGCSFNHFFDEESNFGVLIVEIELNKNITKIFEKLEEIYQVGILHEARKSRLFWILVKVDGKDCKLRTHLNLFDDYIFNQEMKKIIQQESEQLLPTAEKFPNLGDVFSRAMAKMLEES